MRRTLKEFTNSKSSLDHLWEMAVVGHRDADKKLPKGMKLEVETSEYHGTGEEPHMHLYPASHINRKGKANNYDLITRVKVTEEPPQSPDDVVAIKNNPPVPKKYKQAIFEWSKGFSKRGFNNWDRVLEIWEAINNSI